MGKDKKELGPLEKLSEALLIEEAIEEHGKGRFILIGKDGNAYSIMARVARGLRRVGWPPRAIKKAQEDMMSGDYNHLLQVAIGLQHEDMERAEELAAEAMGLRDRAEELMAEAEGDY